MDEAGVFFESMHLEEKNKIIDDMADELAKAQEEADAELKKYMATDYKKHLSVLSNWLKKHGSVSSEDMQYPSATGNTQKLINDGIDIETFFLIINAIHRGIEGGFEIEEKHPFFPSGWFTNDGIKVSHMSGQGTTFELTLATEAEEKEFTQKKILAGHGDIVIARAEDWSVLYLDGQAVLEDHKIEATDVLGALGLTVQEKLFEPNWCDDVGQFPKDINDAKFE